MALKGDVNLTNGQNLANFTWLSIEWEKNLLKVRSYSNLWVMVTDLVALKWKRDKGCRAEACGGSMKVFVRREVLCDIRFDISMICKCGRLDSILYISLSCYDGPQVRSSARILRVLRWKEGSGHFNIFFLHWLNQTLFWLLLLQKCSNAISIPNQLNFVAECS